MIVPILKNQNERLEQACRRVAFRPAEKLDRKQKSFKITRIAVQ